MQKCLWKGINKGTGLWFSGRISLSKRADRGSIPRGPAMEERLQKLEEEVGSIKERNFRVESDKGWETSWTRRLFITISTYVIAGVWLVMIDDSFPWLKAFVPSAGYLLSTLSLPFIKKWWIAHNKK